MPITPFQVTLWVELLAAGLGGLQGALFAAGVRGTDGRRHRSHRRRDARDVILSLPFSVLHVGTLYAVAAGAGTGVFILLAELGTPIPIAGVACVVTTSLVRLAAVRFNWTFPEQFALHRRRPNTPQR